MKKETPLLSAIAMALVAGLCFALCFPPFYAPILAPCAILLLAKSVQGLSPKHAFYVGWGGGMVWFCISLRWLWNLFGSASLSLCAIAALAPALFCTLFVWLPKHIGRIPLWLLSATVWTGVEYLRTEIAPPNFGWLSLSYGFAGTPLAIGLAPLVGSYGITFSVVALGTLFLSPRPLKQSAVAGAVWLSCLYAPLPETVRVRAPLSVLLVQADSEDEESLFALASQSAFSAEVIVFPEYSFLRDPQDSPKLWAQLQSLAKSRQAYLLFGAKEDIDPQNDAKFRNTAFLLSPKGEIVARHIKNHLVPFIKDGIAGKEARAITTPLGRLGVGICFDFDFPDVARRLTEDGAEVILAPSDNPREWGSLQRAQHRQLFQMRAAECGRWIAVADVADGTYVVNPKGHITQSVHTEAPTLLEAQVGKETHKTLFVLGGWRFGSLCFGGLLGSIFWSWLPAKAKRRITRSMA